MPHPKNAGFRPGENWQACPVCGFDYRASDFRRRWDGLMVCKEDWEPRHPQDFLRVSPDDMRPAVQTGQEHSAQTSNPVCPTLFHPLNDLVLGDGGKTVLKFGEVLGISSYNIYLWKAAEPEPSAATATVTQSPYYASGLDASTEYRWVVRAVHDGAESQGCDYKTFSTIILPPVRNDARVA